MERGAEAGLVQLQFPVLPAALAQADEVFSLPRRQVMQGAPQLPVLGDSTGVTAEELTGQVAEAEVVAAGQRVCPVPGTQQFHQRLQVSEQYWKSN